MMKDRNKSIAMVRKAQQEIRVLMKELRAGTLDRKKLESGLNKLQDCVVSIPPHAPGPEARKK